MPTDQVAREYEQLAAYADPDGPLAPYLAWVRERLLPIFTGARPKADVG